MFCQGHRATILLGMNRRDFIRSAGAAAGIAALGQIGWADSSASGGPNILVLYADQHNAGVLGCAGHPDVKTPHMDRLASEGVRFNRAYCQDGVCVPSRASMMTGQYCRTIGVLDNSRWKKGPESFLPLAQYLQSKGYRTAAFGKRHMPRTLDIGFDRTCSTLDPKNEPSDEHYWDWVKDQGQYDAFMRDWMGEQGKGRSSPMGSHVSELKPENTMEAYTARKTIDFLREAGKQKKPFFCWTSFLRPHQPYTPPKQYADMYDQAKIQLPASLYERPENLPPGLKRLRYHEEPPWCLAKAARDISLYRRYIAYYYALVTEVDHHIGSIMEVLRKEGLDRDTIVIYTSDHGDFVGAHGMIEKSAQAHNVYEDTLRVPLIIRPAVAEAMAGRWPTRLRKNAVSDDLIELIDLYPTLLDLAGVERPKDYRLPGRSLVSTLKDGKAVGRDFAISESLSQVSIITPRHKLGVWIKPQADGYGDMLFDRERDPYETHNFAGDPEYAEVEKQLRGQLKQWESSVSLA